MLCVRVKLGLETSKNLECWQLHLVPYLEGNKEAEFAVTETDNICKSTSALEAAVIN